MGIQQKLGLRTVISTGVGMIIATSCIFSLAQGSAAIGAPFIFAMLIALIINICTALSLAELNTLMPNLTGGLAQYSQCAMGSFITIITMVGGYIACNTIIGCAETSMFGNTIATVFPMIPIPAKVYTIAVLIGLILVNMNGVDVFAKLQDIVAYTLIGSMFVMAILGCIKVNPEHVVSQPVVLDSSISSVLGLCSLAFFLFIGAEFIIPIAGHVKNPDRNMPLGMALSLVLIFIMQALMVFGFSHYVPWGSLADSTIPHVLYGTLLLGPIGKYWMALVSLLAVTSTINSQISSVGYIILGMTQVGMLPKFLGKTNRKGAPFVGMILVAGVWIVVNAIGVTSADFLNLLILTGCVFWMISYMFSNINVIILRRRYPDEERSFKLPCGYLIPLVGSIGTLIMILNIDPDPDVKMQIYKTCGIIAAVLAVYAAIWVKFVMKDRLFRQLSISEIMDNEEKLFRTYHQKSTRLPSNKKDQYDTDEDKSFLDKIFAL